MIVGIVFSCNNPAQKKDSSAASSSPDYPFKISKPDNWDIGSKENTLIVLQSLKAYESGKVDEWSTFYGDSVQMGYDGFDKKLSKDSLKALFLTNWKYNNVSINVRDWESVISKDKKDEWVTVWFSQSWETKDGIKDSIQAVNDFQVKEGKIVSDYMFTRKYHN